MRGDTLSKIAAANKTTVANIKALNHLTSDLILVGQRLVLGAPASPSAPSSPSAPKPAAPQEQTPSSTAESSKINTQTSVRVTETVLEMPDLSNAIRLPVNYDVKLNGKLEPFRTSLNSSNPVVNVVSKFGQRFTVNHELIQGGKTYLELKQNGQVVGYTLKEASVEVPQGKNVVYIDAGHGGRETGAFTFGVAEKDLNLNITRQLASRLSDQGYVVHESRTDDKYIALTDRDDEPNKLMPDIFVSVHHNAMPVSRAGTVNGIVTLYHDPSVDEKNYETMSHHKGTAIISEGKRLAQALQKGLVNATGARDIGAAPQNLHVTRTTDVPAALVELGFQDNQAEFKKLTTPAYQEKLISGLLNGINNFFGKLQ